MNTECNKKIVNPQFLHEGTLPPRATIVPALHENVYFKNKEDSELIQVLNGDFCFSYQESDCISEFYREDYDDSKWDVLEVPSMWQYHGYGKPCYPNIEYPIPFQPPYVCCENPVGYYRKTFTAKKTARTILYFGGVDNAYFVYLNGEYVGASKGSRLPAEFDVSSVIREGENLLCVKVFTYSDATYLENQDMLLASGIFRDVMLYHLDEVSVWDYYIRTEKNTILVDVFLQGNNFSGHILAVEVDGCVQKKAADKKLTFCFEIENPKLWSAEIPALYKMKLELKTEEQTLEMHTKKIGFMDCKIEGNQFLVNGTPITLKGICRHEHDPQNGRAITVEQIEKELKMIKDHNMNAIRCAHYPNHPAFYEIASELGIYVMDEGDIETHGSYVAGDQGYLSKREEWLPAYLDRTERMVERDKNETCIIIWSVGNEYGTGENVDICAKFLKNTYGKKPVWFATDDVKNPGFQDFRADGYFTMETLMSYPEEGKPLLLLEYGHAMGNSPGLMEDTWDYIYTHRHVLGGYVWEFKNHGFYCEDEKGKAFYQYGGDFNDANHWSNFSMDGYCLSDGTAKPSLRDCKNVLAPTYVTYDSGKVWLTNTNDFRCLDYVTLKWEICEDYHVLRQGECRLPAVKPRERVALDIDTNIPEIKAGAAYMVNLRFYDEHGFEIAFKQILLENTLPKEIYQKEAFEAEVKVEGSLVHISGHDYSVEFRNGVLCKYVYKDQLLIDAPMKFNIYRAPIDNDGVVNWSPRWITKWDECLLKHFQFYAIDVDVKQSNNDIILTAKGIWAPTGKGLGFHMDITYIVLNDGLVLVNITGKPYGDFCEVLPRIGVCFEMSNRFKSVEWYGRGIEENYSDRKAHCNLGYYRLPVEEMNFLYDVPQECGTRIDTSFVKVTDDGCGLAIVGSDKFSFSYHDFTMEALTNARHRNELEKSDKNYLYIDYIMRGLGSHSCGPNPEECYELRAHDFRFVFALTPETDSERLLELARMDFGAKTERLSDTYRKEKQEQKVSIIECNINRD